MSDIYEIIEKLCGRQGVSGREATVAAALTEILKDYKCEKDSLGNLIATVREADENEKTVVLEAHMDRIGLMVSHITEDGFLHALSVGGTDTHTLMGSEVVINTESGEIPAVVGLPFPYPAKPHNSAKDSEYKIPKSDEMFIDTGLEKPADKVRLGNEITTKGKAIRLLGTRVAAPCLDDRACVASLIYASQLAAKDKLSCGLKLLFSTREEIGGMGAKTGVFSLGADYAVAVDTNSAVSPDVEEKEGTVIGKGVQIDIAPILDSELTERLIETAKKEKIDYQLFVSGRTTGTDADELATVGAGIRTALLSLPIRFMHHPLEVADIADIEKTAQLLAAFVKGVK